MKRILATLVAVCSLNVMAADKLVTIDGDMLAHFGNYIMRDWAGKTSANDTEVTSFDIDVNMAWKVQSQLWVGAVLGYATDETEVNGSTFTDETTMKYGVRAIYDLGSDSKNTLYVGASYIMNNVEDSEDDTDNTYTRLGLEFGKRMGSFAKLAGANVTYAPSIEYRMVSFGDDAEDTYDDGTEIKLNIVKFDILF